MVQLSVGMDAKRGRARLRAPPPRDYPPLPACRAILPSLCHAVGRRGQGIARLRTSGCSTSILSEVDLSTVFFAFSAIAIMKSSWLPLVANAAVSVPVVAQGVWLKVLRSWWTKRNAARYYPTGRCASGFSVSPSLSDTCSPASPRSWVLWYANALLERHISSPGRTNQVRIRCAPAPE